MVVHSVNSIELLNEDSKKQNVQEIPFEEALALAGLGQYTYILFAVSLFSFLCGSIELFSVSLISASAQCDLELNVYKKGFIASAPMLGIVASAHLWGYLADTRGRKYCLMLSMAGNFIFAFAASFAFDWEFLAIFKFFSTACSSGTHSVTCTMLGEMTPVCYRTRFLQFVGVAIMSQSISVCKFFQTNVSQLCLSFVPAREDQGYTYLFNLLYFDIFGNKSIGTHIILYNIKPAILRPPSTTAATLLTLAYLIQLMDIDVMIPYINIDYCPWRMLTQALALFSLINLIVVKLCIYESPKFYCSSGRGEKGLQILRKIYVRNTGNFSHQYIPRKVVLDEDGNGNNEQVNLFVSAWRQTVPLFGKKYLKSTLLVSYVSIVVYSLSSPFIMWLPLVLEHYSENMNTTRTFCQVIQEKAAERIERNGNITIMDAECHDKFHSFTLLTIGGVALYYSFATIFSVYIIKYTGRKWLLVGTHIICSTMLISVDFIPNVAAVFVFMGALSILICMGVCAAYAVDLFPTYFRAMAVCLTIMMGRGFSFISINLIGPELENNCSNFMYIVAAFMFSGAIAGLFLPEPQKPIKSTSPVIIITEPSGEEENCEISSRKGIYETFNLS